MIGHRLSDRKPRQLGRRRDDERRFRRSGNHAYASAAGPRTITVALRDGTACTPAPAASLAVLAANTPPVGANDTYSVHSGDTLSIGAAAGLLANDTDADADTLSVVSVGAAANGT